MTRQGQVRLKEDKNHCKYNNKFYYRNLHFKLESFEKEDTILISQDHGRLLEHADGGAYYDHEYSHVGPPGGHLFAQHVRHHCSDHKSQGIRYGNG